MSGVRRCPCMFGARCAVPSVHLASAQCPVPGAQCPVSSAHRPVSGVRCPVPGARCPAVWSPSAPRSQRAAPNANCISYPRKLEPHFGSPEKNDSRRHVFVSKICSFLRKHCFLANMGFFIWKRCAANMGFYTAQNGHVIYAYQLHLGGLGIRPWRCLRHIGAFEHF